MDIVFMGTPEFAVPILLNIIKCHNVKAVITQPDKPSGRGKKLKSPPVKEEALKYGIPIYQPLRIKNKEFVSELKSIGGDVFVVAAYGQLLSKEILDMPKYGCINVHGSLLPEYRGAAPVEWAIINGEEKTGITIMQMNEGLDTGDMLFKKEMPIDPADTGESLRAKLSALGGEMIGEALRAIEAHLITPVPQNDEKSSYAPMLKKELGLIDWNNSAASINNLIRGLNPWPCAYSSLEGHGVIKILKGAVADDNFGACPATVIEANKKDGLIVSSGEKALEVLEMQAPGSKRMSAKSYMLGHEIKEGQRFG